MKTFLFLAALIFGTSAVTDALSTTKRPVEAAVQPKISTCESCHGSQGRMPLNSSTPKLSGQNKLYLKNELNAFKSHSRRSSTMEAQAAQLSDAEIDSISEYFSSQSCQ